MTDARHRTANGSLDTAHYVRLCHRQRSLRAHAALARFAAGLRLAAHRAVAAARAPLRPGPSVRRPVTA